MWLQRPRGADLGLRSLRMFPAAWISSGLSAWAVVGQNRPNRPEVGDPELLGIVAISGWHDL
jgi:hypothetical protein